MPSKLELIRLVSAKMDEVLPDGTGFESLDMVEGPTKFIDIYIDKAADWILRNAPIHLVMQCARKAEKHFPVGPTPLTGLLSVGDAVEVGDLLNSIENVSAKINGVLFPLSDRPVTGTDPTAGNSRRDIVVIDTTGTLQYIEGDENVNPDLLDFPDVPVNTVLVMKVINIDGAATYIQGSTILEPDNPNVRLIYDAATKVSFVPVPTNFIRFVNIKLDSWKRPVNSLIPYTSPAYINQRVNRTLRGTEYKPVASLIPFFDYIPEEIDTEFPNKNLAIECFTADLAPSIEYFNYIPETIAEHIPNDLIDVIVAEAAARCFTAMRMGNIIEPLRAEVAMFFSNKTGFNGEQ